MYRGDHIEAPIIAIASGGSVAFLVAPLLSIFFDQSLRFYISIGLCYGVVAAFVAYIWPHLGWRTGLWFFVSFPFAILAALLFTDPPAHPNWRGDVIYFFCYASVGIFTACLGGWLGAKFRKQKNSRPPAAFN